MNFNKCLLYQHYLELITRSAFITRYHIFDTFLTRGLTGNGINLYFLVNLFKYVFYIYVDASAPVDFIKFYFVSTLYKRSSICLCCWANEACSAVFCNGKVFQRVAVLITRQCAVHFICWIFIFHIFILKGKQLTFFVDFTILYVAI